MLSLRTAFSSVIRTASFVGVAAAFSACGGNAFKNEDDPSGSNGGSGGGANSGGASSGGLGSGASASGGSTGGAGTGATSAAGGTGASSATGGQGAGGVILGSCSVDDECRAVVDFSDTCGCRYPFAASVTDIANNPCLVPWGHHNEPTPAGCVPREEQVCPEIACQPWPGCAGASCVAGTCSLHDGNEGECRIPAEECLLLLERYRNAIEAARACDPASSSISCNGAAGVSNECGCPVILNEQNPHLVEAAHELRNEWDSSGCAEVTACPPIACAPPDVGTCTSEGVCVAL